MDTNDFLWELFIATEHFVKRFFYAVDLCDAHQSARVFLHFWWGKGAKPDAQSRVTTHFRSTRRIIKEYVQQRVIEHRQAYRDSDMTTIREMFKTWMQELQTWASGLSFDTKTFDSWTRVCSLDSLLFETGNESRTEASFLIRPRAENPE